MIEIINNLIREEDRKEALEILENSTEEEKKEFLDYYNDKNYNVCCLVLDTIKDRLVKDGIMGDGNFGNSWE